MDGTHFLTAIEESKVTIETKASSEPEEHEERAAKSDEDPPNSDLIDFATEDAGEKPRKPRAVDRFFADQTSACLLSPIKPSAAASASAHTAAAVAAVAALDQTQESLDLKLDSTDCANRAYVPQCVQPNDSSICLTNVLDENFVAPAVEGDVDAGCAVTKDGALNDNLHPRKRFQDEMEPAVFDVPRATKIFHREKSAIPEFRENSAPLLQFTSETDNLFKPRIDDDDDGTDPRGGSSDAETYKKSEPTCGAADADDNESDNDNDDNDHEVATPRVSYPDEYEPAPSRGFNITLDMTLRTSGGVAFATGLFLAIDEALDPLLGAVLPYGGRRRGVNIAVLCISILIAIYLLFFTS